MSQSDTDDLPDWGLPSKADAVDKEEFGDFVYTGRDAETTPPDDDDDDNSDNAGTALKAGSLRDTSLAARTTSVGPPKGAVSTVSDEPSTTAPESKSPSRRNGSANGLGYGRPSPLSPAGSRVTSASNDEFPALRNQREGLTRARSSYGSIASIAQSTSGSQFPQRPLAHPAFSRLRSISTQTTPHIRNVSSSTYNTALEYPSADGAPRRPGLASGAGSTSGSVFGGASRRSSVSNVLDLPSASEVPAGTSISGASSVGAGERVKPAARTVKWSPLRKITSRAFPPATGSAGAAALSQAEQMVKSSMGQPTVMAVHGLIAIGTTRGWTLVCDFTQNLRCVCGTEAIANESGAVTALAISQDHTFVAVGHENGSIHLYALVKPSQPARSVPPVTLPQVLSGRKEGHLVGSKICRLGFVGERHTAIVSSDDQGLAFYHSLGKVLMLASTDIIRMLGRYPDPASAPSAATSGTAAPQRPPLSTAQTAPPGASVASPPDSRPESPAGFVRRPRVRNTDTDQPAFPRPSRAGAPLAGSGKKPAVVLDMAPLPLGTGPHPASDALSLVAILTPTKLVVVGLKPTPRTWWRFALPRRDPEVPDPQEPDEDADRGFAVTGVLAWWPSQRRGGENGGRAAEKEDRKAQVEEGENPLLAWAWGKRIRVARVRSKGDAGVSAPAARRLAQNPLKAPPPPTGVEVETFAEIHCDAPILGLRWYTERVVIVITATNLDVFDVETKQRLGRDPVDIAALASSDLFSSAFEPFVPGELATSYSGSFAVYKRKLFELRREDVRAGAILAWADRVLALMQPATILDAIETATAYHSGQVDASTISLPENPSERRELLEPRLREILAASVDFVFSEDRLRDGSHSDGETIQRLFEGLVATSVHACLALDDADWLFDELYERYEQNGIEGIFLDRLEPFVLDGAVYALPPSVTQRLIAVHADRRQFVAAERIILHVEPSNLDLNQALRLCEEHRLYDGLFHVYSQALHDWTTPVVQVLSLVQRIVEERQQRPRHPEYGAEPSASGSGDWPGAPSNERMTHAESYDERAETISPTVYKLFGFLSYTWLGLAYPSGRTLDEESAAQGRRDISALLFSPTPRTPLPGRSSLVLPNVLYPYVTLLLLFDAEALLDTLDQAFEDPFLDGDDAIPTLAASAKIQRQDIVDILLHVASTDDSGLTSVDLTFVRIFVARNLPKYPQYIRLSPTIQQQILVDLVTDADQSTLEDRQLASEYLLSAYTPPEIDTFVPLLEQAGFLRILRQLYQSEGRWSDLATTYLQDDTLDRDIFALLWQALQLSARAGPDEKRKLADVIVDSAPDLANRDESALSRLAHLVSRFLPTRHVDVLRQFGAAEWRRFVYLRCLFEPEDGDGADISPDPALLLEYVASLCRNDPRHLVTFLSKRSTKEAQDTDLLAICEKAGSYDAVVWALDKQGEPVKALARASEALEARTDSLLELLLNASDGEGSVSADSRQRDISVAVEQIRAIAAVAIQICVTRATGHRRLKGVDPEELWYNLLSSLVATLRAVRSIAPIDHPTHRDAAERRASLSSLIQHGADEQVLGGNVSELLSTMIPDALSALVSSTNSHDVSFPRLVRRLIEATPSGSSTSSSYAEFKGVITSMLDTYAFESDLLDQSSVITAHDLFVIVEIYKQERERGWRPGRGIARTCCAECLQPLWATGDGPASPAMSRSASASLLAESLGPERPRMQKRPSIKGKEVDWPGLAPPARTPPLLREGTASVVAGKDGRLWHLACHLVRSA